MSGRGMFPTLVEVGVDPATPGPDREPNPAGLARHARASEQSAPRVAEKIAEAEAPHENDRQAAGNLAAQTVRPAVAPVCRQPDISIQGRETARAEQARIASALTRYAAGPALGVRRARPQQEGA
jgi:hypothetical protein